MPISRAEAISVKAKEKNIFMEGFYDMTRNNIRFPTIISAVCTWIAIDARMSTKGEGGNENPFPTSSFSFPLLPACTYPLDGGGGGESNQQSPE